VVQANREAEGRGAGAPAALGPQLTAREVASRLRVSIATVYRLCETGILPHARVLNAVRVGEDDLRAFVLSKRKDTSHAEP
jgi:excisionase family DNA binding protein